MMACFQVGILKSFYGVFGSFYGVGGNFIAFMCIK
jgi:hypothetical protein